MAILPPAPPLETPVPISIAPVATAEPPVLRYIAPDEAVPPAPVLSTIRPLPVAS